MQFSSTGRAQPAYSNLHMSSPSEITLLLAEVSRGERRALDALFARVYEELRVLAHAQLGRLRPGDTLSTTVVVHEAYLRLVGASALSFNDRKHFFTVATLAMRQIVVDYARKRMAKKRGGGAAHVVLDELEPAVVPVEAQAATVVALDGALTRLARVDERLGRVVELRFFGGLSVEEVAELLEISTATVKRDTRAARAFLAREMIVA